VEQERVLSKVTLRGCRVGKVLFPELSFPLKLKIRERD
jgi:hypothetical protein